MNSLAFETARAVSIVVFFFYGWFCLASDRLVGEFERYKLPRLRRLTGVLEIAGAFGLMASYLYPPLVAITSGCLALMMLLGIATRVRIRDSWVAMLPAATLMVMNLYVLMVASGS